MSNNVSWAELSEGLAGAVDRASTSVIQVLASRRPTSGVVYAEDVVVANARALGRADGLKIRRSDGTALDAELAGWDPATGLAVLRVPGLEAAAIEPATAPARVGHLAVALGRSWSNAITASVGNVAVIGGPLATGRRRSIEEVIRTTAVMHDGFAGGAFVDTEGRLLGICTAAAIRGLSVVIPARIAWAAAAHILEHGRAARGYLGLAGQPVSLTVSQRNQSSREGGLLVVGVTPDSPAAAAGLLVGDVVLDFDGREIAAADDLLDLLSGRAGQTIDLRVLRGTVTTTVQVHVGERPEL